MSTRGQTKSIVLMDTASHQPVSDDDFWTIRSVDDERTKAKLRALGISPEFMDSSNSYDFSTLMASARKDSMDTASLLDKIIIMVGLKPENRADYIAWIIQWGGLVLILALIGWLLSVKVMVGIAIGYFGKATIDKLRERLR